MGTTIEDIKTVLWAGADTFRGVIDAANYKDYILSMLFIKYLDDTFEANVQELIRKYNGNEVRIERAKRNLPFFSRSRTISSTTFFPMPLMAFKP